MRPRLGFLGVGWIGAQRMASVAESGIANIVAVADVVPEVSAEHAGAVGAAAVTPADLLGLDLDGVVIATPSALHAEQALAALSRGMAVFCQKPLGRDAGEAASVVAAARESDRLLGVDFSYRRTAAAEAMADACRGGDLGRIYAAELVFHNAYGPDKAWFADRSLSGGGCVIDLGIHLVDLALWLLGWPPVCEVTSRLYRRGRRVGPVEEAVEELEVLDGVEDYATARLDLAGGVSVALTCSWFLHAGCDAQIGAVLHGTEGSVAMRNLGGSFYDFETVLRRRTSERRLAAPPDAWGGRTVVDWVSKLAKDRRYDEDAAHLVEVAEVVDRIYGRGAR